MMSEISSAVRFLGREVLRLEATAWRLVQILVIGGAVASAALLIVVWMVTRAPGRLG